MPQVFSFKMEPTFFHRTSLIFVTLALFFLTHTSASADTVSVSCTGTSVSPSAVTEADLLGDVVTFTDGGGDGYCVLDESINAYSVLVESGVTISHVAQDVDGVSIRTDGDFILQSGAAIDVTGKGCQAPDIDVDSGNFSPDSSNVCIAGGATYTYASGAGGGGNGGSGGGGKGVSGTGSVGQVYYGSPTETNRFGSSSARSQYAAGGAGGGYIYLDITGNLTLNGALIANGGNGKGLNANIATGGGGGGGIFVTATALEGTTGTFSATGGNGFNNTDADGGGGGGGRISIIVGSNNFVSMGSGVFTVAGGTAQSPAVSGGNGTVYVKEMFTDAVTIYHGFTYDADLSSGTWTVDSSATAQNCGTTDPTPSVVTTDSIALAGTFSCTQSSFSSLTFSSDGDIDMNGVTVNFPARDFFNISGAENVTVRGNSTITANVQWINAQTISIEAGSSIYADGLGCTVGGGVHSNGYGPNGSNVCTLSTAGFGYANGGGGAGHGGSGGTGVGASGSNGGTTYGSSTAPILFGSSSGASIWTAGGSGGGVIRLNANSSFQLNGVLSADGGNGYGFSNNIASGGGSGGSIYITTGSFTGSTGSLTATGGNGFNNATADGGGGGGGRVAIEYGQDSFTGTLAGAFTSAVVLGGSGPDTAGEGANGTLSFVQTVFLSSFTITDNSGYTNDTTPVLTLSQSGATPTHVAFSCNGGSNWSAWLAYPDDNVVNDDDGPAFNITSDATGCSGSDGLKTISAKIKNANSESSAVSDSTTLDTLAPVVSNVTSTNADGTYGAAEVITVTVQFSDTTMQVTGTPQIQLDMDGTDRQAGYVSTSTDTLSFTYTIATGDNKTDLDYAGTGALTLNGGTITDLAGNTATLTLASPGAAGSLGANKALNIVTNQAPTVASITGTLAANASGDVTITFIMDDPDNDDTLQAKVEYSLNGGSSWADPTLSITGSETFATYGDPGIDNAQTRQVGQGTYITSSSGANTVSIVWEAATDIPATDIANARIRITPYDGTIEGGTGTSANFIIDLEDPTGLANFTYGSYSATQVVLTWTAAADTNFNHYEIWYGQDQSDVQSRAASEWDDDNDASLATAGTTTTTLTADPRNRYFKIFAVDDYGNESEAEDFFLRHSSGTAGGGGGGGGSNNSSNDSSTDEGTNEDSGWGITDLEDHWASNYLNYLEDEPQVEEAADDLETFRETLDKLVETPDDGVNRGEATEFLIVLIEAWETELTGEMPFTDVPEDHSRAAFIQVAYELGLVDGYPNKTFQPELVINRVETLKFVTEFFGLEVDASLRGTALLEAYELSENPFTDVDLDSWYAPYVIHAYANGVVSGYGDGTFGPGNYVTCAELLKMAILYQNFENAIELAEDLE